MRPAIERAGSVGFERKRAAAPRMARWRVVDVEDVYVSRTRTSSLSFTSWCTRSSSSSVLVIAQQDTRQPQWRVRWAERWCT